ncbi:porin [Paraburkholderia terricola]|uniref:Porin n=1 Tax=Paraburkholderia terricola TaxID=169427 RepID=A0ABU1M2L4_9BURK|nr:porin [Paraburkholderia terricola]MDR6413264.1 putative porin [Paraburkholderia terricola]MDR6485487.1 putative porin [Paraburkholderia terricola]
MRKRIFAIAITMNAMAAQAQSSVTLYGRIDNGFRFETGLPGGHRFNAESGDWGCSWLGLRGAEDLGGGTQAIFQLESVLNTQTGELWGNLFGRHATIGVANPGMGTLKLGNLGAGELSQDSLWVDPQFMQRYAVSTLVRGRNWASATNGFEYTSPDLMGLTLKVQYDLTNNYNWNISATPGGQGRTDTIEATYNVGAAQLRVIYDELRGASGTFDNVYVHSRSLMAGGAYTVGPVRFYAGYQHLGAPGATNASVGVANASQPAGITAPTSVDHAWLGAAWRVTGVATVTGGVYHANANHGNGNGTMYTFGGTYNLSKRTFLYAELGYLHNSSTSNLSLGSDSYGNNNYDPATGTAWNDNPVYGHSQAGVFAGIMISF